MKIGVATIRATRFRFFLSLFFSFVLSLPVWFLYRLLRFYFPFPALLGGGFCYSVISSRRYPPPALLASLGYAYPPCVLSSFLRWCWLIFFFLLSLPVFDFDLDIVYFHLFFSCGYYAVSSVSVSAATRPAYDTYLDTYARWSHLSFYSCLRYTIGLSYCVHYLPFYLFPSFR